VDLLLIAETSAVVMVGLCVPMSVFDDIGACAVDVSLVCRGRRMEREIR
jgi:hypothetical protein